MNPRLLRYSSSSFWFSCSLSELLEYSIDAEDYDGIEQTDEEEKHSRDEGTNYSTSTLQRGNIRRNRACCDYQSANESNNYRRVAEGEPHSNCKGSLPLLHQFSGRVVNGRDVICIHAVAQTKDVTNDPQPGEYHGYSAYNHGGRECQHRDYDYARVDQAQLELLARRDVRSAQLTGLGRCHPTHLSQDRY